jgi:hypothetical protein
VDLSRRFKTGVLEPRTPHHRLCRLPAHGPRFLCRPQVGLVERGLDLAVCVVPGPVLRTDERDAGQDGGGGGEPSRTQRIRKGQFLLAGGE